MDASQSHDKTPLEQAVRRANLLSAAAQVSQHLTQIRDIDTLLPKTVDIICDVYEFYYAGVFLIDDAGEYAVLQAGRGEAGQMMLDNDHRLAVGGNSMIGACTALNEARISLDVDTEKVWYPNPVLPKTRSEMALPLAIGDRVIGAVTVQSTAAAAFSDEDIASLQAMANQLAIAIDNARQQRELEETHAALVQAKTFEAVATATGDAIHWIGNKAEPIKDSVERVRGDLQLLVCLVANLLNHIDEIPSEHGAVAQLFLKNALILREVTPGLTEMVDKLSEMPSEKLERRLSFASILEDLQIIDEAGHLIMRVKEDLIGPAREDNPRPVMLADVVKDTVHELGGLSGMVMLHVSEDVPMVVADPVQLNRVFANLLKNGEEAVADSSEPRIDVGIERGRDGKTAVVTIRDNGAGIVAAELDKIWVTFHTTKSSQTHTGLGLPAVKLILDQLGGDVLVASEVGHGTTFTLTLPAYVGEEVVAHSGAGNGRVLLIDDDDGWQQFAQTTLREHGYDVTLYTPEIDAASFAEYDLILVDDLLTQRNSLEIVLATQGSEATGKILMVSSNPRVERTKGRKLLGIYDLIPKPYSKVALLNVVEQTLAVLASS